MRLIRKEQEPVELTVWKRANPKSRYQDLDNSEQGKAVRQAIRKAALKEQFFLGAYCCKSIDENRSNNEHIATQHAAANQSLDFDNIIASCITHKRCNDARGHKTLQLTPLMKECETELKFYLSGKVIGNSERASQTIRVLALDGAAIREERRRLMESLLYGLGITARELQPDENGELPPFSPALVNILRQLLADSR